MLTTNKTIYGPFDFLIDDGTEVTGTGGANGDTDAASLYKVQGLKGDTIQINETIEDVELEDGIGRPLQRVAEMVLTFSEFEVDDIAAIQGAGGGNKNHAVVQFIGIDKELYLPDATLNADGGYCVYKAEIDGGKTKITVRRSTSDTGQTNIQKNASVTPYDA